jgi:hypothetical protein
VNASVVTVRGRVSVAWTLDSSTGAFQLSFTIPPNMQATLFMPGVSRAQVLPHTRRIDDDEEAMDIGSGSFTFTAILS